jgi:hypothetical protein
MIRCSQESLHDKKDYAQQEHRDGNLVDAMHDPDVGIGWAVGVLASEKISSYFPEGKKILPASFRFFVHKTCF